MKIKKEYAILIIVIVALSMYLILHNPNRSLYRLPSVPNVAGEDITKIEIVKPDTSVLLNKKSGSWQIAPKGYPADPDKVKNMLDIIEKLTVTALVSESKNYILYDLNDDKKITIKAWAGDMLTREFDLGKKAPSYRHTFVKLAGDDRVYHARTDFREKFDQTVENLRDKTVFSFEETEIQEIRITKGEQSMVFNRKPIPAEDSVEQTGDAEREASPEQTESIWQNTDGKKGDESSIDSLLSTLSRLSCKEYMDGSSKDDFANPIYTIQLIGAQEYTLSIFAKKDKEGKDHPAISSENDYPFVLSGWKADKIMKNPDEMLKKPDKSKS